MNLSLIPVRGWVIGGTVTLRIYIKEFAKIYQEPNLNPTSKFFSSVTKETLEDFPAFCQ